MANRTQAGSAIIVLQDDDTGSCSEFMQTPIARCTARYDSVMVVFAR
jgi:hypothetical protein